MALEERTWRQNGAKIGLQGSQTHKRTNQDPDERSQKPEKGPQEPTRPPEHENGEIWGVGGGATEPYGTPRGPPPSPSRQSLLGVTLSPQSLRLLKDS